MFEISASASFEASHYIEAEAGAAHYRKVHGHSFVVTASVASQRPDQDGWVMDLGQLEGLLKRILGQLDHQVLNDVPGLEKPTFENILLWIESRMKAEPIEGWRGEVTGLSRGPKRGAMEPSGASAYALYLLDRIIGYRSALDTVTTHVPEGERDTSKAAAAVANVTAASSRARVLVAIAREGDATNEEIAERTGLSGDTVRPRVGELRAGGYIERTGEKRLTTKGNEAELHRLTDDGWRKIRELQDAGDVHALRLVLTSDEPRLFAED